MQISARSRFDLFLAALRRASRDAYTGIEERAGRHGDDLRLFGYTFGAGFLFTSLFIA
ncbi:hypothetical protein WJT74_07200 [Sphingomicrobium sp. XHP0239]|uniref:hypothetical protein n=1 Tax=Sphingomicrobium maritimum TaxID=3133972 RepID=UPI0031CCB852